MKKVIPLLLVLAMCLCLAACGGTGNEAHDYILSLLEKEEYDMAIYVIEGLRDGKAGAQSRPDDSPSVSQNGQDQVFRLSPEVRGNDMIFHMDLINYTDTTLTLVTLVIEDYLDGQLLGTYGFEGEDLSRLPISGLELAPGEGIGWDDGHPVTADFNRRNYIHVFHDPQGNVVRITYEFDFSDLTAGGGDTSMEAPAGDWFFNCFLENTGSTPWTLVRLEIINLRDGTPIDVYPFESGDLDRIGLGGLTLEPGQNFSFPDGHPAVPDWNGRDYVFHFTDGSGKAQTLTCHFENLDARTKSMDYAQDAGKDLQTLRHDADFQQEVYAGVYWVPAAALGSSRYSNQEIHAMLTASPEEKQQRISTLYEALQLYQVGDFRPSDDNIRIRENQIDWEHHKPGYHAVRTNTGCCATDSNWLRYILDGDYEEVGFLATSQRDGGGHVYNYILHEGWYYFIDLTHYRASDNASALESGNPGDYHASDFILGNIHKTRNVQDYVDYVQKTTFDPPGLMFLYTAENVLAVDCVRSQSGIQITYEEAKGLPITVIFDDPSDSLTFGRAASPSQLPDWNALPDYPF